MEINNHKTISLPVHLKKGQTLKFKEQEKAVVYDRNWNVISTLPLDLSLFIIPKGTQSVNFNCDFENPGEEVQAKIEFILYGAEEDFK